MKKKTLKKTNPKALVLSMAFALAIPLGASAQEGLFQRGVSDESYYGFGNTKDNTGFLGNRNTQTTGVINNQIFGQQVPLGSGMIILLAAGAGYAALKRKEDEK